MRSDDTTLRRREPPKVQAAYITVMPRCQVSSVSTRKPVSAIIQTTRSTSPSRQNVVIDETRHTPTRCLENVLVVFFCGIEGPSATRIFDILLYYYVSARILLGMRTRVGTSSARKLGYQCVNITLDCTTWLSPGGSASVPGYVVLSAERARSLPSYAATLDQSSGHPRQTPELTIWGEGQGRWQAIQFKVTPEFSHVACIEALWSKVPYLRTVVKE